MFGTIYKSYSGLQVHSDGLSVNSNNLANINTVGFKRSSANFSQIMTDLTDGPGGNINPFQIGLGASTTSIMAHHTQGTLRDSGISTNMAIVGDGMFMTRDDNGNVAYTRAGNFIINEAGELMAANGSVVQGFTEQTADRTIDPNGAIGNIVIDYDIPSPPRASSLMRFLTNLSASATEGETYTTVIDVWDAEGNSYPVTANFVKSATTGEWEYSFTSSQLTADAEGSGVMQFDENGILVSVDGLALDDPAVLGKTVTFSGGAGGDLPIQWDLVNTDNPNNPIPHFTNFSAYSNTGTQYQDGFGSGELQRVSLLENGTMMGFYTNGDSIELARVTVAQFPNLTGLKQIHGGFYQETTASGEPNLRGDGLTTIKGGTLEMSNVDIAEEFTGLISHQRGFQGNSKAVTTVDQIIQEVLGLRR